jgi:hypothetical protein
MNLKMINNDDTTQKVNVMSWNGGRDVRIADALSQNDIAIVRSAEFLIHHKQISICGYVDIPGKPAGHYEMKTYHFTK